MKKPIPSWIAVKLAQHAIEHQKTHGLSNLEVALGDLEAQSATIFRAELAAWPTLADLVSAEFLNLLQQGVLSVMTTLERASLVLIEADSRSVSGAIHADDLAEFTHLKWQALVSLLREVVE